MKLSMRKFIAKLLPGTASVGLEITDESVKMVELALKNGALPIVQAFGSEPLPDGAVVEGRIINVVAVIQAIQAIRQKTGMKTKNVHLILPSQHVMVRFLKFPDIPDHEMKKLIDFELKHNIHLPFEEPYYDFVNLNGLGSRKKLTKSKKRLEDIAEDSPSREKNPLDLLVQPELNAEEEAAQCDVMLVAASMELIQEYKEAVESAGLTPISMEIKALSLYRIIAHTHQIHPESTVLFVDLNDKAADVSIYHEGQLKITRSLQVNFHHLRTQPSPDAPTDPLELLLLGIAPLDHGIDNLCAELVHELERLMNFYRYTLNNREQEFDCLILTGDIARFNDVVDSLRGRMSQTIMPMQPQRSIELSPEFGQAFASLAVPFGLALRGRD